jgi:hypothetical protein
MTYGRLGDSFLRSAYVVYDLKGETVSMAPTKYNATDSNIVEIELGNNSVAILPGASSVSYPSVIPTQGTSPFSVSTITATIKTSSIPAPSKSSSGLLSTGTSVASPTGSGNKTSGAAYAFAGGNRGSLLVFHSLVAFLTASFGAVLWL